MQIWLLLIMASSFKVSKESKVTSIHMYVGNFFKLGIDNSSRNDYNKYSHIDYI